MHYYFNKNIIKIIITLLIILFFVFLFLKPKTFEGFSSDYQYLAPVSGTWSQATQDAYSNYINDKGGVQLSTAMQLATEDEAKQYISTGLWPYDTAVINLYNEVSKTNPDVAPITDFQKMWPNRWLYSALINMSKTNPSWNLSLSPTGIMNGNKGLGFDIGNNQQIQCKYAKLGIVDTSNNAWTDSTDYSLFEKITGFKFNSTPCNACDVNHFCDFTYNNVSYPESYYIYYGKNKPTSVTDDNKILSVLNENNTQINSTTNDTSKPNTYYDDFVSLCKKVVQ